MTLSEFREALNVFGVDPDTDFGKNVIDRILTLFGRSLIASNKGRCSNCWMKKHDRCSSSCSAYDFPEDPILAAKMTLVNPNDINVMSFVFEFVVPIYEKDTGDTGTIEKIKRAFAKRMRTEFGNVGTKL